jgi:Ca2+:H+ antiporter
MPAGNALTNQNRPVSPSMGRRVSYADPPNVAHSTGFQQVLDVVDQTNSARGGGLQPIQLPPNMTTDDFTRAVAVATVSALRQQQAQHAQSPARMRVSGLTSTVESEGGHQGHDAPSWSRFTSASVLLACTALYAAIAGAITSRQAFCLFFF